MMTQLSSERLFMRQMTYQDEAVLADILTDQKLMAGFGGALAITAVPAWIEKNVHRYLTDGYSYLLLYAESTGEFIGIAGLIKETSPGKTFTGIAYLLKESAQGQGYAREAVAKLLEVAFSVLALKEVRAQIAATNVASIKLVTDLGFIKEAEFQRVLGSKSQNYHLYVSERS